MSNLPLLTATRYVTPLREGGSLPAILETAPDNDLYVTKFRGAGQGAKALLAELLVGSLARAAGLNAPSLSLIKVLPDFGRTEPDPEIQDLLRASHGVNVGMQYLDGAFNYDGMAAGEFIDAVFASRVVWLDAFVTNPDRTARNPNLMIWNREPWLIDHGAALYAHFDWASVDMERTRTPFNRIRDHVLLSRAEGIRAADEYMRETLTPSVIGEIVEHLPEELLADPLSGYGEEHAEYRDRYRVYLSTRLEFASTFVDEAEKARNELLASPAARISARR